MHKDFKFKVGDKVTVLPSASTMCFPPDHIGKVGTVRYVDRSDPNLTYQLDMDDGDAPWVRDIDIAPAPFTVEDAKALMRKAATTPDATTALLAERGSTHGSFTDNAEIAQAIKEIFRNAPNWPRLSDVQREGLDLKATKLSRYLSGNLDDPKFADNLVDDIGYTTLMQGAL